MKTMFTTIALFLCIAFALQAQETEPIGEQTVDHPEENFEKLWHEFNDRYAFFDLKQVSWQDIYQEYRPRINDKTTNSELFDLCCEMISTLADGHVSLVDERGKRRCRGGKKVRFLDEFPNQSAFKELIGVIDGQLSKAGFAEPKRVKMEIPYISGHIIEYAVSAKLGYLRINLMIGLPEAEFTQSLDTAIEDLKDAEGIIIDVRFNSGGLDRYAYAIANRFADQKRLGHSRRLKDKNGFSDPEFFYLQPAGKRQIVKPIMLLTSSFTISAADVFVLAMKQLPYVTIIGENTQGFFSDAYQDQLPNGWTYTLSFQQYFDASGQNLEGIGVEPHIRVVNTRDDLREGRDPVLEKAIELLESQMK